MYYYGYNGSYGMNSNPCMQAPTFAGYTIGDIVWNLDGNSEKLGWILVKDAAGIVKWRRIEELIRSFLGS